MPILRQRSFIGGQLDPGLEARTDFPRRQFGARRIKNFLVDRAGALVRRPGFVEVRRMRDVKRLAAVRAGQFEQYLLAFTQEQGPAIGITIFPSWRARKMGGGTQPGEAFVLVRRPPGGPQPGDEYWSEWFAQAPIVHDPHNDLKPGLKIHVDYSRILFTHKSMPPHFLNLHPSNPALDASTRVVYRIENVAHKVSERVEGRGGATPRPDDAHTTHLGRWRVSAVLKGVSHETPDVEVGCEPYWVCAGRDYGFLRGWISWWKVPGTYERRIGYEVHSRALFPVEAYEEVRRADVSRLRAWMAALGGTPTESLGDGYEDALAALQTPTSEPEQFTCAEVLDWPRVDDYNNPAENGKRRATLVPFDGITGGYNTAADLPRAPYYIAARALDDKEWLPCGPRGWNDIATTVVPGFGGSTKARNTIGVSWGGPRSTMHRGGWVYGHAGKTWAGVEGWGGNHPHAADYKPSGFHGGTGYKVRFRAPEGAPQDAVDFFRVYKKGAGGWGFIGTVIPRIEKAALEDGGTRDGLPPDEYRFLDDNIPPDYAQPPPTLFDPWQDKGVTRTVQVEGVGAFRYWPGCAAHFQQRWVFGGSEATPRSVLFSTPSQEEVRFGQSAPVQATDYIERELHSREGGEIRHLAPFTALVVLTSGGQWVVQGGGSGVTPQELTASQSGGVGCGHLEPILTPDRLLHTDPTGRRVFAISPQLDSGGFQQSELTALLNPKSSRRVIVSWTWVNELRQLWVVYEDGMLGCATVDDEWETLAWTEHELAPRGGDGPEGAAPKVLSVEHLYEWNAFPEGHPLRRFQPWLYVIAERRVGHVGTMLLRMPLGEEIFEPILARAAAGDRTETYDNPYHRRGAFDNDGKYIPNSDGIALDGQVGPHGHLGFYEDFYRTGGSLKGRIKGGRKYESSVETFALADAEGRMYYRGQSPKRVFVEIDEGYAKRVHPDATPEEAFDFFDLTGNARRPNYAWAIPQRLNAESKVSLSGRPSALLKEANSKEGNGILETNVESRPNRKVRLTVSTDDDAPVRILSLGVDFGGSDDSVR